MNDKNGDTGKENLKSGQHASKEPWKPPVNSDQSTE